jgi:hypothetical protein
VRNQARFSVFARVLRCQKSVGTISLIALVAIAPIRSAHAYVDPNAAGSLFQFLFPALIAITSFFAAFKRVIRQLWTRMTGMVLASIRGDRTRQDGEQSG